ncbi:MAG: hypothetical protein ABW148_15530 [Sedimenticola sp.]
MLDNIAGYIWFLIGIAAIIFLRSVISAAGKDAWSWLKGKINTATPEPIEVSSNFAESITEQGKRAWIRSTEIIDRESKGFTYFPHPTNSAKCFRKTNSGNKQYIEYLMTKPQ